jgi:hypothetical protein
MDEDKMKYKREYTSNALHEMWKSTWNDIFDSLVDIAKEHYGHDRVKTEEEYIVSEFSWKSLRTKKAYRIVGGGHWYSNDKKVLLIRMQIFDAKLDCRIKGMWVSDHKLEQVLKKYPVTEITEHVNMNDIPVEYGFQLGWPGRTNLKPPGKLKR